jgi:UDP-2-acetamido-2,6-beta-L-arabino-hexul-4-ose reductase
MYVLITGAQGFVGKNLCLRLSELEHITILPITRDTSPEALRSSIEKADFIFHLAGINRPQHPDEFKIGNADFTQILCDALIAADRAVPIVYTSSTQAELDNPYGVSKRSAEEALLAYQTTTGANVFIYRLPNVFGKWCKPNYNSAVATFCHNTARDLEISINNSAAPLQLVYIDDVVDAFTELLAGSEANSGFQQIAPIYTTTVGQLADHIKSFKHSRDTLITEPVGTGFLRALYSTYVSYLPTDAFSYKVPKYGDARGVFVEMLKTPDAGQFSFFTAHPGITRGDHYHHTKTEKFLVIKGKAHFGFRNVSTGESHEITTNGDEPEIVETVPGWTHNITNVGTDEMIVMLWANEIFDRQRPDTIAQKV